MSKEVTNKDITLDKNTLLSPQQAADILRVSKETLNVWRTTKRYNLSYVKIGRLVYYTQANIKEFIENRTVSGI